MNFRYISLKNVIQGIQEKRSAHTVKKLQVWLSKHICKLILKKENREDIKNHGNVFFHGKYNRYKN